MEITWTSMLKNEVLIWKFVSVYAFASCAISFVKITTLAHEAWNYTVKRGSFVSKSLFPSAKGAEIFYKRKIHLDKILDLKWYMQLNSVYNSIPCCDLNVSNSIHFSCINKRHHCIFMDVRVFP